MHIPACAWINTTKLHNHAQQNALKKHFHCLGLVGRAIDTAMLIYVYAIHVYRR